MNVDNWNKMVIKTQKNWKKVKLTRAIDVIDLFNKDFSHLMCKASLILS